jgi:acyl-CoA reductase-like NAD-dependent aldehyde dehydrogenase
MKIISPSLNFELLIAQLKGVAPELFSVNNTFCNLMEGRWQEIGSPHPFHSPVDGSYLGDLPFVNVQQAENAVLYAKQEQVAWAETTLDYRKQAVQNALDLLRTNADLIAKLIIWEIGKTYKLAFTDIDRAIDGVQWYVEEIDQLIEDRTPIGLVSNIASWNYPMSVLLHAVLVQVLCGNSAIAKTPTDGGFISLSLAFALCKRAGLPVSLVSGAGSDLSPALVASQAVDCLSFVGGRYNGRNIADALASHNKRYMLEMEGVNAYGIWEFSEWDKLAAQLKSGYDYGKQRCTAYVRFVVQRKLFPKFLETYLSVVKGLTIGNPTLVDSPDQEYANLSFGPVINKNQVEELNKLYNNALQTGATPLYEGILDDSLFLPNQDRSSYFAPRALVNLTKQSELYFKEPFGPIDSIVLVDRIEELVGEMNISNGALVAAIASDDEAVAKKIGREVRAFKIGINKLRSRGDKAEPFGGLGESWKGAFVGGGLLVEAVTNGAKPIKGNFGETILLPENV